MKKASNNKKNYIILVIIMLLIIVCIVWAFYFVSNRNPKQEYIDDNDNREYVGYNEKLYYQNDDIDVIMIVGLDSYENNVNDGDYINDSLADFVVLLALDKQNKTVQPIQINRDTMVHYYELGLGGRIVKEEYGQLALSHTYGSGGLDSLYNTKDAVSNLCLGIDIQNCLSLSMGAVEVLNDDIGGVEVYIEDDFSNVDPSIIQGQTIKLIGDQALTFVRARGQMNEPTNVARMKRQRDYLKAFINKAKTEMNNDDNILIKSVTEISKYLVSNLDVTELCDLANTLLDCKILDIMEINGDYNSDSGYMQFYPNEGDLISKILSIFYLEKE